MTRREPEPSYPRPNPVLDLEPLRRVPPSARQVVFALDRNVGRSANHYEWTVSPMVTFLPLGLFVFDASSTAVVDSVRVGNRSQPVSDYSAAVPARYFDSGRSFEAIRALAERGELGGAVGERQLFELDQCEYGGTLSVHVRGDIGSVCVWGMSAGNYPLRDVRIWREAGLPAVDGVPTYRAEVVDITLAGNRVRFGCNTESEGAAVELVKTFLGRGG